MPVPQMQGRSGELSDAANTQILFVDLNNSARFPALAVGYLVAALRRGGLSVDVFSPLANGVPGFIRDLPDSYRDHLIRRIQFATHPAVEGLHDVLEGAYKAWTRRPNPQLRRALSAAVDRSRPQLILVSAYLDHRQAVEMVASIGASRAVPVLLGGPMFNDDRIAAE